MRVCGLLIFRQIHWFANLIYFLLLLFYIMSSNQNFNGTVKWFNPSKGYGFIQMDNNGKDIFVHITALQDANIRELQEGQRISFEVSESKGRSSAVNLKLI